MESIYPVTTTRSSGYDQSRRKRKKKPTSPPPSSSSSSVQKWRSEKQQQIYSTNIIQSLRELRISAAAAADPSAKLPPPRGGGGRAVRDAAYRSLAVTARGRTLWSRAILSKAVRVKLRFRKLNRSRNSNPATVVSITGNNRLRKKRATVLRLKGKGLPAVQKRVKFLSRLIPGCRKQPLPVVLEETTDYIVAMEMQIRALNAIISAVGSGSSSSPPMPEMGHDGEETRMLG
ncbi:Transcription factor bHLH147 [Raphanus sativus]|uniref:Transcription factor bHLH147-like n=1 Tax=Raphanus sativus TaxID=3726 RepID=A0A6J0N301_RAPSA|nr:transcription factor bHLH147-like [Raphanus sativus]KAJ4900081.1 Transcription factor bHLH147 [Raphanus sativus]